MHPTGKFAETRKWGRQGTTLRSQVVELPAYWIAVPTAVGKRPLRSKFDWTRLQLNKGNRPQDPCRREWSTHGRGQLLQYLGHERSLQGRHMFRTERQTARSDSRPLLLTITFGKSAARTEYKFEAHNSSGRRVGHNHLERPLPGVKLTFPSAIAAGYYDLWGAFWVLRARSMAAKSFAALGSEW